MTMKQRLFGVFCLFLLTAAMTTAQRPANAPATAPAGKPPDSVFIEDLTWAEVRDLIKSGSTTVIVGTAGTEQKGPHMVDGEHKFVMDYAADKIARALGKTLVAPIITYVPEGSWENTGGHMGKPGTITLPEDRFVELLVKAGRSLKSGGFKTILFLGESGGNRTGMRTAADRLNELWKGDRARALDRRLLHEVARRSERATSTEDARRAGESDRQPRQHPRHLRDDVRQRRSTCARIAARRRLREQRRQRRPSRSRRPSSARRFSRSRSTTRSRRSRR